MLGGDRAALVTGASGFIGRHVLRALREEGHRVRALVHRQPPDAEILRLADEVVHGDVTRAAEVRRAVRGADVVIHLAAKLGHQRREILEEVNVGGTRNLASAVRLEARDARLVFISSAAAGGPTRRGTARRADEPCTPISDYGRSKRAAERLVAEAGIEYAILRPPLVYGPGAAALRGLVGLALRGVALDPGGRRNVLAVIAVRDLARGILAAAAHPGAAQRILNLTGPRDTSLVEFMSLIAVSAGRRALRVPVPAPLLRVAAALGERLNDSFGGRRVRAMVDNLLAESWALDREEARRRMGFEALVDLEEGIPEMLTDFRERGWLTAKGCA